MLCPLEGGGRASTFCEGCAERGLVGPNYGSGGRWALGGHHAAIRVFRSLRRAARDVVANALLGPALHDEAGVTVGFIGRW